MGIDIITFATPDTLCKDIAYRIKERRLERNLTQKAFAKRSGVGYDAYRKFENSGDITLRNLLLCAVALNDTESFSNLFTQKAYQSIDELLVVQKAKKRKRGSKNE